MASRQNVTNATYGSIRLRTATVAAGLGYRLTPRTPFAVDVTAGRFATGAVASPFASAHASVRRELTKRLFATGSFLTTSRSDSEFLPTWRSRYTQVGVGWRAVLNSHDQNVSHDLHNSTRSRKYSRNVLCCRLEHNMLKPYCFLP
jgi:hypothetical protein